MPRNKRLKVASSLTEKATSLPQKNSGARTVTFQEKTHAGQPSTHVGDYFIPPAHSDTRSHRPQTPGGVLSHKRADSAPQIGHIAQSNAPSRESSSIPSRHSPDLEDDLDDEVDSIDDHIDKLFARCEETTSSGSKKRSSWVVNVIHEDGTIKEARYIVQDVWSIPAGRKVIVPCNDYGQVVGDAGGLLGGFLGVLGSDFSKFPICYVSWRKVPKKYKDKVYSDIIQKKFHIVDNQLKCDIMKHIGKTWKDTRGSLFHEFFYSNLSLEENVARHPAGIDEDHWRWFLEYRLNDKTKEMCLKNDESRKKQLYTHTGGSKSIARRNHEEERQRGSNISRGELWVMLHKKNDGSYINDDAQVIGEKIVSIDQEDESSKIISQNDSLSQVLGRKQSRGVSYGSCPTRHVDQTSRSTTSVDPRLQTEIDAMKSELEASRLKMQNLEQVIEAEILRRQAYEDVVKYMLQMQESNLPPELAALLNAMSTDEGSLVEPVSPGVIPSSSAASAQHDHTNQSEK